MVDVNIDDYERDRNSNINVLNVRKDRKRGKEKIREVIVGTNGKEVMMYCKMKTIFLYLNVYCF
jgi:hypothetical protein